eukprot:6571464-Lingulodinium_polyedra.AAC.1
MSCHVMTILWPCHRHDICHAIAMQLSPRYCHVIVMLRPCYCQGMVMVLPCYCHAIVIVMPLP